MKKHLTWKSFVFIGILFVILNFIASEYFWPIEIDKKGFPLEKKWHTRLSDKALELSTSEDGIIFALSPYSLNAIDSHTGTLLWKFITNKRTMWAPAISKNDLVYFADNEYIRALDEKTGTIVWKQGVGYPNTISIVDASSKIVLVHSMANAIFAYDALTGDLLWSVPVGRGLINAVIDDRNETVCIFDHGLNVVNAISGKSIWQRVGDVEGLYENGILYTTDKTGIQALDPQTRSIVWNSAAREAAPAYLSPKLLIHDEYFVVLSTNHVNVFQKDKGALQWSAQVGNAQSPAVLGDTLFVLGLFSRQIYSFDIKTGNKTGTLQLSLPVMMAAEHHNITAINELLVFSNGKNIYAYGK